MTMRAATKSWKEKASPSCCLVYWPEELAVTVVEMKKVKYKELTVGEKCEIAVGNDTFTGLLYAWGDKDSMVSLQEQYEEGIFDPVPDEDGGVLAAPDGGVPDGEESDKDADKENIGSANDKPQANSTAKENKLEGKPEKDKAGKKPEKDMAEKDKPKNTKAPRTNAKKDKPKAPARKRKAQTPATGQGFKILKVCGLKDETEDIEEVEEEEGYGTSNYLEEFKQLVAVESEKIVVSTTEVVSKIVAAESQKICEVLLESNKEILKCLLQKLSTRADQSTPTSHSVRSTEDSFSTPVRKLINSSISNDDVMLVSKSTETPFLSSSPQTSSEQLHSPEQVYMNYPKLHVLNKIGTLASKLSREAYFGTTLMSRCTVYGTRPALPLQKVKALKSFLITSFKFNKSALEFEPYWKYCVDAINHSCNFIRKQKSMTQDSQPPICDIKFEPCMEDDCYEL